MWRELDPDVLGRSLCDSLSLRRRSDIKQYVFQHRLGIVHRGAIAFEAADHERAFKRGDHYVGNSARLNIHADFSPLDAGLYDGGNPGFPLLHGLLHQAPQRREIELALKRAKEVV